MDGIAQLTREERAELFTETAARMGVRPIIAEKDFWVCWTLKYLFALPAEQPGLIFKGGTSLSKVYGLIRRFSEDIDLAFDRRDLGFGGDRDPETAPSGKARQRRLKELGEECGRHIAVTLVPTLQKEFGSTIGMHGWQLAVDEEKPLAVHFAYPKSLETAEYDALRYLRPVVTMELGARSDHWPAEWHPVTPYVADKFPDLFTRPSCNVKALAAQRAFWEKALLLHAQFHQRPGKPVPERQSRHYFDMAMLAQSDIKDGALAQHELLARVAVHSKLFFGLKKGPYEEAIAGKLRLLPHEDLEKVLRRDYAAMQEMIFRDPPSFDELLAQLKTLEGEINASERRAEAELRN
ncbi:MAG: nucleotidyl transferase AbiEii/AbiGii toxin family protein [Gemmatimonadales bacterium]|nr:nucleotidyl transferase AbiEii/AbiGii toxin family protein [Gemmatimonadales bacterium]NIN10991.1 nucleotidyl transferase AbiEii/AbiGii toxin family protein [Gemmatimonadales bacterium]NIN49583.1 nucleotidyl transferase AbiEii/AbiGii toxin family protein [Gemmatimonadales bacterium]NIP07047.1 nucleotidyl transferase AbiEii/AbiGii toxin family protein [Gemmatimonadales bacterium]NIR01682.1 nucleotidyl transferase AbiEii/AbiGii toxin family protein [Gemmatimonadales bacterium]